MANLGAVGAGLSSFTQAAQPFIQQIVQDARKKRRKQDRTRFISRQLLTLNPDLDPTKVEAFANLSAEGVGVPFSTIQGQPERVDIGPFIKKKGLPDYYNTAYQAGVFGDYPLQAVNAIVKFAGEDEATGLSPDSFDLIKQAGGFENIPDYATYEAVSKVRKDIGASVGQIIPSAGGADDGAPDQKQRIAAVLKEMEEMELWEIKADDSLMRRYFAAGGTERQLEQSFGFNPDALDDARASIMDEVRGATFALQNAFGVELVKWVGGEDVPGSEGFEKYFDRLTGEITDKALFERAEKDRTLELRRLGMEPAKIEAIPDEIKGDVLKYQKEKMTKADMEAVIKFRKNEGNITIEEEKQLRLIMEHLDG